jgi:hypothetical protein
MIHATTVLSLAAMLVGGDDPGRVDPDRPTVSQTTKIVAPRAVQVELGVDAQVHGLTREDQFRVSVPALIRIGLHERVELRLFDGDPYRWIRAEMGSRQQGEISLGAKIKLLERGEKDRTTLGLQTQVIPMQPLGEHQLWAAFPGALLLLDIERSDWTFIVNLGTRMEPESATVTCCKTSNFLAFAVARTFADERVRVWAETYARLDLPKPELGELAGDTGLVVNLSRRVALDAGVLVGRAKDRLVVAVLGGLSVRWGP